MSRRQKYLNSYYSRSIRWFTRLRSERALCIASDVVLFVTLGAASSGEDASTANDTAIRDRNDWYRVVYSPVRAE